MNPTPAGMPRELLRRVRAHNYRTRTERLALVNAGISALEDYSCEEIRTVLPGRKVEWITTYGTIRNAVVHPDPERLTFDDAGLTISFFGRDGRMFTVAREYIFTVSSSPVFHRIRAPRKVRNVR